MNTAIRRVESYRAFRSGGSGEIGDADRIRQHALEHYIEPARLRGEAEVLIRSRDINDALALKGHWRNIWQALRGARFQQLANVPEPRQIGADESSATQFVFALEGPNLAIDRAMLERLRTLFLERHPTFASFADSGSFAAAEDNYKRALVARAGEIVRDGEAGSAALGGALLDLVQGKTNLESNLLDWRTAGLLDAIRKADPGRMEAAAARLVTEPDGIGGVVAFADELWSLLPPDLPSRPFAESRCIPSMVRALVDGGTMLPIRSRPTDNATRMLLGRWAFGANPLTRAELAGAIALARALFEIMRDEWHWGPRDLWDVQGFLWETCQKRLDPSPKPAPSDDSAEPAARPDKDQTMPSPTNLILYGPPGTGKTYATALEAVRLCRPDLSPNDPLFDPGNRPALLAEYARQKAAGQIDFVTFHQSYSYEDFVEGLRPPMTGEGEEAATGLTLTARPGVFHNIAVTAEQARRKPAAKSGTGGVVLGERRVFKMSLGRAGIEDHIFDHAIQGNYIALGWGGEHDWSDPRFGGKDGWKNIFAHWQEIDPEISPNSGNIAQLWSFRTHARVGDIVVVSSGNSQFRAIGEITSDYYYDDDDTREYHHCRDVRWIMLPTEPLPVELIYTKGFSQASFYQLNPGFLKAEGLERLISGETEDGADASGPPDQFVLVIDEINRANISKVFGELITLIERDKRLGEPEQLRVRLPYSGKEFGVPANLHIVGTMNTADRSIALLDTALRRRFSFKEIGPDPDVLNAAAARTGIDLPQVLRVLNDRIEYLLDREHRIGHAFFINCKTREDVDERMRNAVIPLLQEYFFENWDRVAAVLGEKLDGPAKEPGAFLRCREIADPFGQGEPVRSWSVRETFAADAYARLCGKAIPEGPAAPEDEPA